jgi:glycosidase
MAEVVMIAKSTYVWLHQLSQRHGTEIRRLDQIPDAELDMLADAGFNALWLIGLWERSTASSKLKQLRGNQEAMASAYALYDYAIAWDLGGEEAFWKLKERCSARGIRLCGDVVPNHTGLYSRWVKEHPDWYVQLDHPPYAAYRFNGPDLSDDPELELTIDDGYYDHSDAAVVFRHVDRRNGRTRFIYHGNDGTHMPWNDTAQLNYLLPEVREAVIRTIIEVAKRFPLIRFDAAMTLAKKHFQRLWYPLPGGGAGVPSRALHALSHDEFNHLFPVEFWREVVDRVAAEAPGTLLLAEAFWLLEGYFVRTLGMHRVYNSAFMNMLKREENAKYRQVLKETLEFNPRILQRFVNFMNNPDEATAVEQFGKGDKYFGVTVLLATLPGLPLFGHGQIEGLREKYGMEYSRPQLDEKIDEAFQQHHRSQIFPLLRRRALFNDAEHFVLYDFYAAGSVNEDVFAFSNCHNQQRALVIFNNRDHQTSGWIKVAAAKREGSEQGELCQTNLGEALQLKDREEIFYRCRELRSGAEMLLQGADIHQRGLELQLGPYQHQVMIDFVELTDTDGCWRQVWHQVGHSTCSDLDRRLLLVRHQELIDAWWPLRLALEADPAIEQELLEPQFDAFYRLLADQVPLVREPKEATKSALQRLQAWQALTLEELPADAERSGVLIPWLIWSALVDPDEDQTMIAELGRRLLRLPLDSSHHDETDALRLATLLLGLTRVAPRKLAKNVTRLLLKDPEILAWLDLNHWQGIDYLNREKLESLLFWLPHCCRLQAGDSEKPDQPALQLIDQACVRLLEQAEDCGYQLEILTKLA